MDAAQGPVTKSWCISPFATYVTAEPLDYLDLSAALRHVHRGWRCRQGRQRGRSRKAARQDQNGLRSGVFERTPSVDVRGPDAGVGRTSSPQRVDLGAVLPALALFRFLHQLNRLAGVGAYQGPLRKHRCGTTGQSVRMARPRLNPVLGLARGGAREGAHGQSRDQGRRGKA